MTATLIAHSSKVPRKPQTVSWAYFQKHFLTKEDGYKYEWLDGEVVKTKAMDYTQFYILENLRNVFEHLRHSGKLDGILITEGDIFFGSKHRRPDVAYFTSDQIKQTAQGHNQIPEFVIEVISNNDQINMFHEKIKNFREANVAVVWAIFPQLNEVHVFGGEALKQITVCTGDEICSASPVLNNFELTVNTVLKRPQ